MKLYSLLSSKNSEELENCFEINSKNWKLVGADETVANKPLLSES